MDSFQRIELSEEGKQEAKTYFANHSLSKSLPPQVQKADIDSDNEHQKYIRYQREIAANKILKSDNLPPQPGRILKLPLEKSSDPSQTE